MILASNTKQAIATRMQTPCQDALLARRLPPLCQEGATGTRRGAEDLVEVCHELTIVPAMESRAQQQQVPDLQPIFKWLAGDKRPSWETIAACSPR
ncbi:UNVERIFIED_CONTAM: hypothetical protein FKN15_024275 [Acipenser sinensis]